MSKRRLSVSILIVGLGLLLLVGAASAGHRAAKEGGTLLIGSPAFDYIDPALVPDPAFAASSLASSLAAVECRGRELRDASALSRRPSFEPSPASPC